MSGEDLVNIGPVALLQDLAVSATLGVTSIERNGHHYFAGLSAFPSSVGRQMLDGKCWRCMVICITLPRPDGRR